MASIYGDIMKVDTTGASEKTAKHLAVKEGDSNTTGGWLPPTPPTIQTRTLNIINNRGTTTAGGVEASKKLAENDLARMEQYKSKILKVGRAKQMDPAVIAAIISRESSAGAALKDGWGDHGNGFGLMQVDKRYHKPAGTWDSEQHLTQGTEILIGSIKDIKAKFPQWTQEQCFKGGISAYNAGVKNVRTYERMDVGTTGDDYSSDVVARAQWFKGKGY